MTEFFKAVKAGCWKDVMQMIEQVQGNTDFDSMALKLCCESDAPLYIIKLLLDKDAHVSMESLRASIHRRKVLQLLLSKCWDLPKYQKERLLCCALKSEHWSTAECLLATFFQQYKPIHRQSEIFDIILRYESDSDCFFYRSIELFHFLLKHFPFMFQENQEQLATRFIIEEQFDFVLHLMQNRVLDPKVVYFLFAKDSVLRRDMGKYYQAMHCIGSFITNISVAKSILSSSNPFFQMSVCRDFMHVKPLLSWWEQCWTVEKPVDIRNQFLIALGYIMHAKEKRKIVRKKYQLCLEKAMPLFFGLQQLQLPVLLQTIIYYYVGQPVSNSFDLHIVDLVFTRAKKAMLFDKQ